MAKVSQYETADGQAISHRKIHLQPFIEKEGDEESQRQGNGNKNGPCKLIDFIHIALTPFVVRFSGLVFLRLLWLFVPFQTLPVLGHSSCCAGGRYCSPLAIPR